MEKIKFKAVIDSKYFDNPPNLRISLDEKILFDAPILNLKVVEQELSLADDQTYNLNFTLYNKSESDTVVEDGEIIKDTLLIIKQVELDNIDITAILSLDKDKFYYKHEGRKIKHTFYDTMGVNGTSTIEFTTPLYVWLLETL